MRQKAVVQVTMKAAVGEAFTITQLSALPLTDSWASCPQRWCGGPVRHRCHRHPRTGRGRPGIRLRRDEMHRPVAAKTLGLELAADAWQQITWRDGSNTPLTSRFARWRVRPAHDDARRSKPAAEEWLLIEWPEDVAEPDHYWLSTLPADVTLERMVDQAKMRWRIERDYLELKQEVGLRPRRSAQAR
jgi:SRSO17 transposase